MEIIKESENKIINIRIWNEREKEDGFLDISEDLSADILGEDLRWLEFMDLNPSVDQILDELKYWEDAVPYWNNGETPNGDEFFLNIGGTFYMTVEVDTFDSEPRIYMVEHDTRTDIFTTVCKDKADANREARDQWESLTANEKKNNRVHVVYTEKTGEFYDDLGEDWYPEAFHSSTSDTDDFDSANKLEYRVCGYDIIISDDNESKKVMSYERLKDYKAAYRGDAEVMLSLFGERLNASIPIIFRSHLESDIDDVIDGVLNAAGYLIDDILAE